MKKGIDIDYLKWKVGYAEGFEIEINACDEEAIVSPSGYWFYLNKTAILNMDSTMWEKEISPLLLQRAIEGINRDLNNPYSICTEQNNIEVYHSQLGMMDGWIRADQDEAKEQALEYIYEQRKNK